MGENFYTFTEYMKKDEKGLTASMEDYLEMIYRLSIKTGYTRINDIAQALNVQPSSVTKMIQKFGEMDLLNYEKYGVITLSCEGKLRGEALLKRHEGIQKFLRFIGVEENKALEETEKIEHVISIETLKAMFDFQEFIESNTNFVDEYKKYIKEKHKDY